MASVAPGKFVPFNFHWYAGTEPPWMMTELNVTDVPEQTGFAEGEMDMLTGKSGLTVIVTTFETAGLPVAQVAFETSTQEISSLLLLSFATKV